MGTGAQSADGMEPGPSAGLSGKIPEPCPSLLILVWPGSVWFLQKLSPQSPRAIPLAPPPPVLSTRVRTSSKGRGSCVHQVLAGILGSKSATTQEKLKLIPLIWGSVGWVRSVLSFRDETPWK